MDKLYMILPILFLVLLTGVGVYSTENPLLIATYMMFIVYGIFKSI